MQLEWARDLRDDCRAGGVSFFMKQLGGHPNKRDQMQDFPIDLQIREFPDV
jgi:protein gp37